MHILIIILIISFKIIVLNISNKKNLIIGAIKNYKWHQLKPFFVSLYKSNFQNYDCVIFFIKISTITLNRLKSIGVILIKIPEKYKSKVINNYRFELYEDYLKDKYNKYEMILHLDVRDTFFQNDIFKLYETKKPFIGLALEDGYLNESINAGWIKEQYNESIFEELKNKRIICVGTILGSSEKFFELIKKIKEIIQSKSIFNNSMLDQSGINYIIYHEKMFNECLINFENNNGPIMTLGLCKNRNFSFDSEQNLLTFTDNNKISIIHQYDRIPNIVEIVKRKFIYSKLKNLHLNIPKENKRYNTILRKNIFIKENKYIIHYILLIICLHYILVLKKLYLKKNHFKKNISNIKAHLFIKKILSNLKNQKNN